MSWVLVVILLSGSSANTGGPSGFRVEFGSEKACREARGELADLSMVRYAKCFPVKDDANVPRSTDR